MLRKLADAIKILTSDTHTVFIGNIAHSPIAIEAKPNEWGGINYKYRVMPGQMIMSLNIGGKEPIREEDEITYLSKHTNIPAFRVTVNNRYDIICSPKNSILIKRNGVYEKADLMKDDVLCKQTPCRGGDGIITGVQYIGKSIDMYDLSLKKNEIFLADDYLYVYDTVSLHVPSTNDSIRDVENMLASRNLMFEATSTLTTMPQHSAIVGLHQLTETPEGRKELNAILPKKYHINKQISQRDVRELITNMDKDPEMKKEIARVVSELRRVGDRVATERGFTLGISDIAPLTGLREETLRNIKEKTMRRGANFKEIYKAEAQRIEEKLKDELGKTDSTLAEAVRSGGRGSLSQVRDLVVAPLITTGNEDDTIPTLHSYAEGITPGEFVRVAKSARRGSKQRSQMTALPGALAKELQSTASLAVIKDDENEYMKTIDLPVDDIDDILDRYVGKDVVDSKGRTIIKKDTLINPHVLQTARKSGIEKLPVYTPLGSSSPDGTIPSKAYGANKEGKLHETGYNIGALSALGLVKPLFMSQMGSFHTGGSVTDKYTGYPRIKQLLEMPKQTPHKAVISKTDGKIESIREDSIGGHEIVIGGEKHYMLPQNRLLTGYDVGTEVKEGEIISDGPADIRELYDHTSLDRIRNYMVDELKRQLPMVRRRNMEVVVESMTRHGEITEPGDTDYLRGDIAIISEIEEKNKGLENPATFRPLLRGVNTLPQKTQDWLSQLGFRNLKRTMSDAVAQGKVSDVHSYAPIPGMAYAAEFGLGEEGKY